MKILPRATDPPNAPLHRRHTPKDATGHQGFQKYRDCLRWDCGFTCPFCLLHESDFLRTGGIEGTGIFSIEHLSPQSIESGLSNDYRNCVYCCRFCNRSRSNRSVRLGEAQLLDPTKATWSDHFERREDLLYAKTGDLDAAYTLEAYEFNDSRKVMIRKDRRELYDHHLTFITDGPKHITRLLTMASEHIFDTQRFDELIRMASRFQNGLRRAVFDLHKHRAIPEDAPQKCRCGTTREHCLPAPISSQMLELPPVSAG
jgi:hypothetical protein